jgi:hypothetical protein
MYQRMNELGIAPATWQNQFRRAAALWAASSNINVVEVADGGQAFAVSGNQQSDPRFGDIRIAGISDSPSVLGRAFLPPPFNGGTLAGDITLNTDQAWKVGQDYDIQTVAVHEFGHSLGLDHSSLSSAVMFASYNGIDSALSADDVAGIQAVYGARQHDAFDSGSGNNTSGTATVITSLLNTQGQVSLSGLDITSTTDNDWFYVVAPSNATGTMRITMQSSGLSSLSPRFLVYNAAGALAGWNSAPNTYGATISSTFVGVAPGTGVFIRALGANTGPTGVGAYGLQVNFGSGSMAPIAPPNTVVLEQPDQGGGSLPDSIKGEVIKVGSLGGFGEVLDGSPTGGGSWGKAWDRADEWGRSAAAPGRTAWKFPGLRPGGGWSLSQAQGELAFGAWEWDEGGASSSEAADTSESEPAVPVGRRGRAIEAVLQRLWNSGGV